MKQPEYKSFKISKGIIQIIYFLTKLSFWFCFLFVLVGTPIFLYLYFTNNIPEVFNVADESMNFTLFFIAMIPGAIGLYFFMVGLKEVLNVMDSVELGSFFSEKSVRSLKHVTKNFLFVFVFDVIANSMMFISLFQEINLDLLGKNKGGDVYIQNLENKLMEVAGDSRWEILYELLPNFIGVNIIIFAAIAWVMAKTIQEHLEMKSALDQAQDELQYTV